MAASTSRLGLQTCRLSSKQSLLSTITNVQIQKRSFHSTNNHFQEQKTTVSPSSSSFNKDGYLTWERYLNLRKQRRLAGMVTTVPSTILAALASGSYFLTQEIDPTSSPIAGIDPVYVYALLTLSCTGLGYLLGPTLGSGIWSLFHNKNRGQIEEKDKEFFKHITRLRVDPSRQTMQNRLPDYYGEKIGSMKDYRQWLRDQATFRRKAAHGVEDDEKVI